LPLRKPTAAVDSVTVRAPVLPASVRVGNFASAGAGQQQRRHQITQVVVALGQQLGAVILVQETLAPPADIAEGLNRLPAGVGGDQPVCKCEVECGLELGESAVGGVLAA
jgi:hypothetical protein